MTPTPVPDFRGWTHPSTGEARHYLDNWAELLGIEVDRYKTGNISGASLNGEGLSNRQAGLLLACKVWMDTDGSLHVDRWRENNVMDLGEFTSRLRTAIGDAPLDPQWSELGRSAAAPQTEQARAAGPLVEVVRAILAGEVPALRPVSERSEGESGSETDGHALIGWSARANSFRPERRTITTVEHCEVLADPRQVAVVDAYIATHA